MINYQQPRPRKGHEVTAIEWNRDGTLRAVTYEKLAKHSSDWTTDLPTSKRGIAGELLL